MATLRVARWIRGGDQWSGARAGEPARREPKGVVFRRRCRPTVGGGTGLARWRRRGGWLYEQRGTGSCAVLGRRVEARRGAGKRAGRCPRTAKGTVGVEKLSGRRVSLSPAYPGGSRSARLAAAILKLRYAGSRGVGQDGTGRSWSSGSGTARDVTGVGAEVRRRAAEQPVAMSDAGEGQVARPGSCWVGSRRLS